jgi:hypothetical protein
MLIHHQPFTDAIEKLNAELTFEVGQRSTDRRLR